MYVIHFNKKKTGAELVNLPIVVVMYGSRSSWKRKCLQVLEFFPHV